MSRRKFFYVESATRLIPIVDPTTPKHPTLDTTLLLVTVTLALRPRLSLCDYGLHECHH